MNFILKDINDGKNISIIARAGCGKTTTLLNIAEATPGKRKEILTYNNALAASCNEHIIQKGIPDTHCSTIHSKFGKCASKVANDDIELLSFDQITRFSADIVMIDEIQDLRPILYESICKILPLDVQIVVVGDDKQVLYDYVTGDEATPKYLLNPYKYFRQYTKREWVNHVQNGSYRLQVSTAKLVSTIWQTEIESLSTISDSPVEFVITNPWSFNVTKYIQSIIDNYGSENVMILSQSVRGAGSPVRLHINNLIKINHKKYQFTIRDYSRGIPCADTWTGRTRVWTYCASKGCQAQVVILFGLDRRQLSNDLGVAASRATHKLFVIHSDNLPVNEHFENLSYTNHLNFVDISGKKLSRDDLVFGPVVNDEYKHTRRCVTDRQNCSARVFLNLLQNITTTETTYHAPIALNCTIISDNNEYDMTAVYGKAFEYLLQARAHQNCPDANVMQFSGSQIRSETQLQEIFTSKGITTKTSLSALIFPLSMSAIRGKCNTNEIQVRTANGLTPYLSSDNTNKIINCHENLQMSKCPRDAVKLANHRMALDSYADLLYMSYDFVDTRAMNNLIHATFKMFPIKEGVFEHNLSYDCLHGRVDFCYKNLIVDFKMGKQSHDHVVQIALYTAMHQLALNESVRGVLYYPREGKCIEIRVDAAEDLLKSYLEIM